MSKEKKYYYSVYEKGSEAEYRFEYNSIWSKDRLDFIAEEIADDYFSNHDGWEASWPLNIYIWDDKHEYIGACSVEMEAQPAFYAYVMKE